MCPYVECACMHGFLLRGRKSRVHCTNVKNGQEKLFLEGEKRLTCALSSFLKFFFNNEPRMLKTTWLDKAQLQK